MGRIRPSEWNSGSITSGDIIPQMFQIKCALCCILATELTAAVKRYSHNTATGIYVHNSIIFNLCQRLSTSEARQTDPDIVCYCRLLGLPFRLST